MCTHGIHMDTSVRHWLQDDGRTNSATHEVSRLPAIRSVRATPWQMRSTLVGLGVYAEEDVQSMEWFNSTVFHGAL